MRTVKFADDPASIEPHPPLTDYYTDAGQRPAFVRGLFDEAASSYDSVNRAFSLGSGAWYRRRALRRAGLAPAARLLDVAVGTGLVAREAVRILGDRGHVIGLDVSERMLAEARRYCDIALVRGRAEQIPLADCSIDFVSLGYALRHLAELGAAFGELHRVLRPGGRLLLLEIGRPRSPLGRRLARLWFGGLAPALCRLAAPGSETRRLMRYFWDTVDQCVAPEVILDQLAAAGFVELGCHTDLRLFRAYTGRK